MRGKKKRHGHKDEKLIFAPEPETEKPLEEDAAETQVEPEQVVEHSPEEDAAETQAEPEQAEEDVAKPEPEQVTENALLQLQETARAVELAVQADILREEETMKIKGFGVKEEAQEQEPFVPFEDVSVAPVAKASTSLVSVDTVVKGDITTQGDLEIQGVVEGNIEVKGKLSVLGTVQGDIKAETLVVAHGIIAAQEIVVQTNVVLQDGSEISGNIHCTNAAVNAKMTGNITAMQRCEFEAESEITGNVAAKELSVAVGAVICGMVTISR